MPLLVELINVQAQTNTTLDATIAGVTITADGADCPNITNSPLVAVDLNVRRDYKLTVIGTNTDYAQIHLKVKPNWQPLSKAGKTAAPRDYVLMINGAPASISLLEDKLYLESSGCGYQSNTWLIQIADQRPYHYYADDGSDDPKPAPGDGTFISIGGAKSLQTNKVAIDWSVSLGRLFDGTAAGRLRIRETGLSPEIYTPTNLYYTAASYIERSQVELVTSSFDGVLRQVKAWQALVDIVSTQASKTTINFYHANQLVSTNKNQNGVYTNLSGSPFVTWTILNPEPTSTNKLYIIETRNGSSMTNSLVFNPASTSETWTLRYGTNNEERVETRGVTFAYGTMTNRIETVAIHYASSNSPAYKCTETYSLFHWGWDLSQTRLDPDNNNLTTTYEYYDNEGDELNYGKPSIFRYPDGNWEVRLYDHETVFGALEYVLRPHMSGPTQPEDATVENSYVMHYLYGVDYALHEIWHSYGGINLSNTFAMQVLKVSRRGNQITSEDERVTMDDEILGNLTVMADETAENGEAFHAVSIRDDHGPDMAIYYHGGTYDAASRSFTTNSTGVGDGPDWRQSVIYYGDWMHQQIVRGSVQVNNVDGEPFNSSLQTNRSYRIARIVHDGSLAQLERAVFTGINDTSDGIFDVYARYVYMNDSLGHPTNIALYNCSSPSAFRTIYQADYRGGAANDGELLLWSVDETGIRSEYQYDSLKRIVGITKKGVSAAGGFPSQADIVTSVRYDPTGKALWQATISSGLGLTNIWLFDLAGRQISKTDEKGLTTLMAYDLGGRRTTTTLPSGATDIKENYLDRRLATRTGTGVVQEGHTYWQSDGELEQRIRLLEKTTFGGSSARWRITGTDEFGLQAYTQTPDFAGNGAITEFSYYSYFLDTPTYTTKSGQPLVQNSIDFDGSIKRQVLVDPYTGAQLNSRSRIKDTLKQYIKNGSDWFYVQTNMTYLIDDDPTPTVVSVSKERLSGFTSTSIQAEITTWDADTNTTVVITYVDQSTKKVTTVRDVPQSTLNTTNITINGLAQLENTETVAAPTRHYYDALGRETSTTSPLGFSATTAYNQNNQIASKSDFTGATLTYTYYGNATNGAGQVQSETRADGKKAYHSYTARGEPYRTWGDVPYPEERVYSAFGELVELHTFQNGSAWNQATWPASTGISNLTLWTYDTCSGQLASKADAAGHTVTYSYTNGLLLTRTWARGVTLTNTYDAFGEVVRQDYSDGTTPVEVNNYSRSGLPREIIDATGTNALAYDWADRLMTTYCSSGVLAGITVSNHFTSTSQRDAVVVLSPATTVSSVQYSYDTYGRLGTVSSGIYTAVYGYLPNADLLRTTTCKSNSTTVLATSKLWDYGVRRAGNVHSVNGAVIASHTYQYDTVNRPIRVGREDGSTWVYSYNDKSELVRAARYWSDWAVVSGQQCSNEYDNIGNRKSCSYGGDTAGGSLQTINYTSDVVNLYTGISNPGYQEICGVAVATNSVIVNTGSADRKGEYFHREIVVGNGGGAVWQGVTNSSGASTIIGGLISAGQNQQLTYDPDGNLLSDGIWTYDWDGENRLVTMTMTNISNIPNDKKLQLAFTYDRQGRRAQKIVRHWNAGTWTLDSDARFVYDSWRVIAIVDSTGSARVLFSWGQDITGTMEGAGGAGGLVLVTGNGVSPTNCFVVNDGNGNITKLINAVDSQTAATYEYSPFGQLIEAIGPMASANPVQFSSKVADAESGLVYYGYRYYSPTLGRWLGRDPSQEDGGINLFAFVQNNPIGANEPLGLFTLIDSLLADSEEAGSQLIQIKQGDSLIRTVRSAVNGMNNLEQFEAGVLEAEGMDVSALMESLQAARAVLANGMKGAKAAHLAIDGLEKNHIFPNSKKLAEFFKLNKIRKNGALVLMDNYLHQYGLHSPGTGGPYNALWKEFADKNSALKNNPYYVLGFGFGLFEKVIPYL